jgi:ppGpp synthetase/RelA/SpoT-type nucleotidyltranferase
VRVTSGLVLRTHHVPWAKQTPPHRSGDIKDEDDSVESTRSALVAIIDDSWRNVRKLVSPKVLSQCEDELKGATSLLVLATVRKAADADPNSRASVEEMFREADKDGDGQITFIEWFEWVSQNALYFNKNDVDFDDQYDDDDDNDDDDDERRLKQFDPMVTGLAQVLGHAVYTLQLAARVPSDDPSYAAAAFIAGGTMAGAMDDTLTRTMLSRLSPRTRDLVALALTLEASSMSADISADGMGTIFDEIDTARAKSIIPSAQQGLIGDVVDIDDDGVDSMVGKDRVIDVGGGEFELQPNQEVIQTVDLSSIPAKIAPSIDDPVPQSEVPSWMDDTAAYMSTSTDDGDDVILEAELEPFLDGTERVNSWSVDDDVIVESNSNFDLDDDLSYYHDGNEEGTESIVDRDYSVGSASADQEYPTAVTGYDDVARSREKIVTIIANAPPEKEEKVIILDSDEFPDDDVEVYIATPVVDNMGRSLRETSALEDAVVGHDSDGQQYSLVLETGGLESTLYRAETIASDINRLRLAFKELDDSQSSMMRHLIMRKSGGRTDVLGLSMALRATRLQHANSLGLNSKHQLAMETLQLWAPLSFQIGVNTLMPELEVHSYVLLFPKSFASFINWYTAFRPIAKKMLSNFQQSLEAALHNDPLIPRYASKVLIQSRLKSPSSAFKKMVKSDSKQRHQLYDMLGVRVIVTDRPANPMEPTDHFDINVFESVNTEFAFDFDEIVEGNEEGFSEEEEQDNRLVSLLNPISVSSADHEATVVSYVKDVILRLQDWEEDESRFKDYVASPKTSGYQSMHMTLINKSSGINLEVQLRSTRMHMEAEYGRASHSRYKALMLPASIEQQRE